MAIVQTQCTVFKTNMLSALENFNTGTTYVYKIALYEATASLNADTLVYTTEGEITGTGYTAGGGAGGGIGGSGPAGGAGAPGVLYVLRF